MTAKTLMVDRGAVPKEKLDPGHARGAAMSPGETQVTGVWRVPDPPGLFHAGARHRAIASGMPATWPAIAAADHLALSAPVVIEADATPNPGGWPRAARPWSVSATSICPMP